jgi:hypothetical protein
MMIHIGDVNVERGILSCIVYLPKMDMVMYVFRWCREVGYTVGMQGDLCCFAAEHVTSEYGAVVSKRGISLR